MQIQPPTSKQLRSGSSGGYVDQYEQVNETIQLWEELYRKYGTCFPSGMFREPHMDNPRNARLITNPVGTGKSQPALRIEYCLRSELKEIGANFYVDDKSFDTWEMPTLLVCDKPAKKQWMEYIRDWVPEYSKADYLIVDGNKQEVELVLKVAEIIKPKVIIANYNKIVDYNDWFRNFAKPWLMVILDEARRIKNDGIQRSQAIDSLVSLYRVGLDGTPQTREPDSLWGVLTWLNPGPYSKRITRAKGCTQDKKKSCSQCPNMVNAGNDVFRCSALNKDLKVLFYHLYSPEWGSKENFVNRYCKKQCTRCGATTTSHDGKVYWLGGNPNCRHGSTKIVGAINEEELGRRLYKETKLATKLDDMALKGMPKPVNEWMTVEMLPKQSAFYKKAEQGLIEFFDNKGEFHKMSITGVLSQITMLRRLTTLTPASLLAHLSEGNSYPEWMPPIPKDEVDGCKQTWIDYFIDNYFAEKDKVIIFSEWTDFTVPMTARLSKKFDGNGYAVEISGKVGDKKRESNKIAFNSDPMCKAIVCSPSANAALNLHEGVHKGGYLYMINADLPWTPDILVQRSGRGARYTFDGKGIINLFIIAETVCGERTIDSRMADKLKSRVESIDKIHGSDMGSFFPIASMRDIMDLLRG